MVRENHSKAATDKVQETFFVGIKSAKKFLGKSTDQTWLVSILKRKRT
ncbi:hypothetical protein [Polaribacter sp. HL-MS24]